MRLPAGTSSRTIEGRVWPSSSSETLTSFAAAGPKFSTVTSMAKGTPAARVPRRDAQAADRQILMRGVDAIDQLNLHAGTVEPLERGAGRLRLLPLAARKSEITYTMRSSSSPWAAGDRPPRAPASAPAAVCEGASPPSSFSKPPTKGPSRPARPACRAACRRQAAGLARTSAR